MLTYRKSCFADACFIISTKNHSYKVGLLG